MPRFVLLFHECPPNFPRPSHWDFMLEVGPALRTWALSQLPGAWRAAYEKTAAMYSRDFPRAVADFAEAVQLADHRLVYLDIEGPLTGDRGSVVKIDTGTYRMLSAGQHTPARLHLEIAGGLLHGVVTLTQTPSNDKRWMLNTGEAASVREP